MSKKHLQSLPIQSLVFVIIALSTMIEHFAELDHLHKP